MTQRDWNQLLKNKILYSLCNMFLLSQKKLFQKGSFLNYTYRTSNCIFFLNSIGKIGPKWTNIFLDYGLIVHHHHSWHKDGYILISLLLLHWSIPTQHNELWPPVTSFAFSFSNLHAHDSRSHLPWCVSVVRTSHDLLCVLELALRREKLIFYAWGL